MEESHSEQDLQSPPSEEDKMASETGDGPDKTSEPRPRTVGGFIVEEEDEDEDEEYEPKPHADTEMANIEEKARSNNPHRSSVTTPTSNQPDHDGSYLNSAEENDYSDVVTSGQADTVPNLAAVLPTFGADQDQAATTVRPSQTLPVPTAMPSASLTSDIAASSVAKTRLPNDRIGMLEDRIKEDPKGDVDAWLTLIAEHRKRKKMDETRAVFDRFFKVFPSAVRTRVKTADVCAD